MSKIKGSLKSKTMWLSASLVVLVPMLESLPALKTTLGDNYQISLFALGVIIGVLRQLTTQPVEEK